MSLVWMCVPAGPLSSERRQALVAGLTDVVAQVEGVEGVRARTTVLVDESLEGGWGIVGGFLAGEPMRAALARRS